MKTKDKVLVIDDDVALTRVIQLGLEQEGYEVIVADSGIEGLRQAYDAHPDLVILDVMMPGLDGWKTCQRLREISDVPIIMLTAKDGEVDVIKGLELGADDYITKPFSTEELVARMRALLRRARLPSSPHRPTVYTDGELVVDFSKHRVMVRGKRVNLTPTEFRLLSCLVRNAGRVIPHETLLAQVWGPEYIGEIQYLKLYIRYLRQKIEKDPSKPQYILTEWGIGYYFREA